MGVDQQDISAGHPLRAPNPAAAFFISAALLLGLTVALSRDVLFTAEPIVLSVPCEDLDTQYAPWRDFGFSELRKGNLALWNPHVFSGIPFFAGFQSALLYPPNLIYLVLPLAKAINVGITIHIFLIGVFMYLWLAYRKLHPVACFFAAVVVMFCGPHYLHIMPGHLSNLCTMVWAPLLFMALDGLRDRRSLGWVLLGALAIAMQILAGHPQYVYYTGLAAAMYTAFHFVKVKGRFAFLAAAGAIVVWGAMIACVQLWTGVEAAFESFRGGGVSYDVAKIFFFPFENLLTLFAPGIFGNETDFPYLGSWRYWEMSLFVGVTALFFVGCGSAPRFKEQRRVCWVMVGVLMLIAFGVQTPLYRFLYDWLPGFGMFRGVAKVSFQAALFLAYLAALGLDVLLKDSRKGRFSAWVLLGLPVPAFAIAWCLRAYSEALLRQGKDALAVGAVRFASYNVLIVGATCLVLGLLVLLSRRNRKLIYLVPLVGIVELFWFAAHARPTFDLDQALSKQIENEVQALHSPDVRIMRLENPNYPILARTYNIWGNYISLGRYAEFIAFTQGYDPDEATEWMEFKGYHRLYEMLRCQYVVLPSGGRVDRVSDDVMPQLNLIADYRVISDRDAIFDAMSSTGFDPRREVILEAEPSPKPERGGTSGTVTLVDSSTDHLDIEAEVPAPSILVITDGYAKGWRAYALPGSVQDSYNVMPANYVVRAVPLTAGRHRLRVEYRPGSFRIGMWISAVSALAFGVCAGWCGWRTLRAHRRHEARTTCDSS